MRKDIDNQINPAAGPSLSIAYLQLANLVKLPRETSSNWL